MIRADGESRNGPADGRTVLAKTAIDEEEKRPIFEDVSSNTFELIQFGA